MLQSVEAIYEDGVLKPLEPLQLAEHQRVRVSVSSDRKQVYLNSDVNSQQRHAMEALDAEMDALPDNSPDDGFTAANHDRLLYGPNN